MIAESKKNKLLTKELIKKAGINSPPEHFTFGVMEKLGLEYKPDYLTSPQLMTRKAFFTIILIFIGLIVSLIAFSGETTWLRLFEIGNLPSISLPEINFGFIEKLENSFDQSKFLIYTLLLLIPIWTFIFMEKLLRKLFKTN